MPTTSLSLGFSLLFSIFSVFWALRDASFALILMISWFARTRLTTDSLWEEDSAPVVRLSMLLMLTVLSYCFLNSCTRFFSASSSILRYSSLWTSCYRLYLGNTDLDKACESFIEMSVCIVSDRIMPFSLCSTTAGTGVLNSSESAAFVTSGTVNRFFVRL